MGLFSYLLKNNNQDKIDEVEETKLTQWQVFDKIYKFINTEKYSESTADKIDELVTLIEPNEIFFTIWGLNHFLLYNKFTRNIADIFFQTSFFLDNIEYIKFYIKYMIKNEIKFPPFRYWYKPEIVKTSTAYKKILQSKLNLSDDDYIQFEEYYRNAGYSVKDLCFMLKYIKFDDEGLY